MTIDINGVILIPQPNEAQFAQPTLGGILNGTEEEGVYWVITLTAPIYRNTAYNWDVFENQVLTSLDLWAPGDGPDDTPVVYDDVIAKAISSYRNPADRTVRNVSLDILVAIV